jgi:hypothetical protein
MEALCSAVCSFQSDSLPSVESYGRVKVCDSIIHTFVENYRVLSSEADALRCESCRVPLAFVLSCSYWLPCAAQGPSTPAPRLAHDPVRLHKDAGAGDVRYLLDGAEGDR